jgi:hypothetical protein
MDVLPLAILAAAAALGWNWWSDRRSADRATLLARQACEQAGVIWLDQNVQRVRKRLARDDDGRLAWRRDYDFEFTSSGEDRQLGRISLVGLRVVGLVGPAAVPLVYVRR